MPTMVKVTCCKCSKVFEKPLKHYNYNIKKYKNIFCSKDCLHGPYKAFSYFTRKTKSKKVVNKYGPSDITSEYLKAIWENQNGTCPYTNVKMLLPESAFKRKGKAPLSCASLDRIDSNKGYVQGNVEFVCLGINYAKNSSSKEEALTFFEPMRSFFKLTNEQS